MLQSLLKVIPSTTLYYKACTKHVPVLPCTTKLAQSTSQYYFVLQSLHKTLPSTTLYYKACTKHFPVLLCTTKLAQVRPSITLYYKPCTSTSQYYFVLQSLHKESFYTQQVLDREAFTNRSFYTQQAFTQRSFYTQQAFTHSKRLHTEQFYTECFYTWQAFTHTHRSFYTEKILHTEKLLHTASFYRKECLQKRVFTQRSFLVHNDIAAPKPDLDAKAKKKTILTRFFNRNFKRKLLAPKLRKSADKSLSQP